MAKAWTLALCVTAGLFTACDNEVELLSDDVGVPVVYGLINGSQEEQLISVSRTFRFSGDGNAVASAQNPDSVFYDAESLAITARNLRNGRTANLTRVNLSEQGVVRAEGRFPTDVNVAYRFRLSELETSPGDSIELVGTLPSGQSFTAGSRILTPLEFNERVAGGTPPTAYSLTGSNPLRFIWRRSNDGAPIQVFEIGFNFAFTEISPAGTRQRILYFAPSQNLGVGTNSAQIELNGIFGFLATRLEADPSITRQFDYMQLVLTGADNSYLDYQTLVRANSGITATQELPPFSNVTGGLGLVGSITQLRQGTDAGLLRPSRDSLRLGSITRDLNFL